MHLLFLACGNLPVKTDCVCLRRYVLSLVSHYSDSIKFSILQIGIFFNLLPFAAAFKLKCDDAFFFKIQVKPAPSTQNENTGLPIGNGV